MHFRANCKVCWVLRTRPTEHTALCSHSVCVCVSHHKLLLRAPHAGASLCVLVCSDQQLNQSGNGPLLSQRGVVCGAESQVTDQTNCRLMDRHVHDISDAFFQLQVANQAHVTEYHNQGLKLKTCRFEIIGCCPNTTLSSQNGRDRQEIITAAMTIPSQVS